MTTTESGRAEDPGGSDGHDDGLVALAWWATSGAMALTGHADGPPRAAPGRPALLLREALNRLRAGGLTGIRHPELFTRSRHGPEFPGVNLLGERAAIAGFSRNAPRSCGGAFRTVPTADGWLGLSLAREWDTQAVPALVAGDSRASALAEADPWAAVTMWAGCLPTAQAQARAELLDLAWCSNGPEPESRDPVTSTPLGSRPARPGPPLVVDLSALWAGPLAAHLLGLLGAEIVKVETVDRPDGARSGSADFFDLLHAGHRMVTVDPASADDRELLSWLISEADLVIESTRPRALRRWGIDAERVVAADTSWLSITAYGRDSDRIGFGDDVAVGAGLRLPGARPPAGSTSAPDGGPPPADEPPIPCGDAIADPLTGVAAAEAAARALRSGEAHLIDVSMHHVARAAATGAIPDHQVVERDGRWWVEAASGRFPVEPPTARRATSAAQAAGADNDTVRAAAERGVRPSWPDRA